MEKKSGVAILTENEFRSKVVEGDKNVIQSNMDT